MPVRGVGAWRYPKMIRCDNGPEFVSRDLDLWAYQRDVTLDFSRPGKPTDNAFSESFSASEASELKGATASVTVCVERHHPRSGYPYWKFLFRSCVLMAPAFPRYYSKCSVHHVISMFAAHSCLSANCGVQPDGVI